MTDEMTLQPTAVRSDEGEARWWFAALAVIKATAADTGGADCATIAGGRPRDLGLSPRGGTRM